MNQRSVILDKSIDKYPSNGLLKYEEEKSPAIMEVTERKTHSQDTE